MSPMGWCTKLRACYWPICLAALGLSSGACVPARDADIAVAVDETDEAVMTKLIEAALDHVVRDLSMSSPPVPGQDGLKIHIEPPPGRVALRPLVLEALAQVAPKVETPAAEGVVCQGVLDCSMEPGTASLMLVGVRLIGRSQAEVHVAATRASPAPPGIWTTVVGSLFEWDGQRWTWIEDTAFQIT